MEDRPRRSIISNCDSDPSVSTSDPCARHNHLPTDDTLQMSQRPISQFVASLFFIVLIISGDHTWWHHSRIPEYQMIKVDGQICRIVAISGGHTPDDIAQTHNFCPADALPTLWCVHGTLLAFPSQSSAHQWKPPALPVYPIAATGSFLLA